MSFRDLLKQGTSIGLLQRSLERGRLAHAYLFTGHQLESLETVALTLSKTLNCLNPVRGEHGAAVDCCDVCLNCGKIDHGNHADIHWARPESKSRIIMVDQVRELMRQIQLKPTEADHKVAIIVAADRLRTEAANAFLKTLEEPPPKSVMILLTTETERVLETIVSRCLRLNFAGEGDWKPKGEPPEWLSSFVRLAAGEQKSLLSRYRLMDVVLQELSQNKENIEESLKTRSPLEQHKDAEKELRERWEAELSASVEAAYRRRRAELLGSLQCWLRDVWIRSLGVARDGKTPGGEPPTDELLSLPQLAGTTQVAQRIAPAAAVENLEILEQLQYWLGTNVQEGLALEVALLKLNL
jgi:DNA polymerase-3 subunit delta'